MGGAGGGEKGGFKAFLRSPGVVVQNPHPEAPCLSRKGKQTNQQQNETDPIDTDNKLIVARGERAGGWVKKWGTIQL